MLGQTHRHSRQSLADKATFQNTEKYPKMKSLILALTFAAVGAFAQQLAPTLEQIKIAADAGEPAAQDKLAERVDSAQAEILYRKAAEQGYVHAQGKLGNILFLRCFLSPCDKSAAHAALADEAMKWATLAANQGDKLGQANLAKIYFEGKWVKQDLVEAYKWGDLSAKNPAPEYVVLFSGSSTRDAAILKMNADQIEEAHRRVAAFVPHQPQKSDLPEPAWVQKIKLSGISGPAEHRLAIINGKTFDTGDRITIKSGGKSIAVQCLEIRANSVLIAIEGVAGPRELKLP